MKTKLLLLSLTFLFASVCSAQSIFHPLPKLNHSPMALAVSPDSVIGAFRPIVVISASVSNGAQLASGLGVGYERLRWDATSQTWITLYSISGVGFIGTNGNNITGTAGLVFGIPGTNGLISAGPGRDFTSKQWVLLTGVQIQFR